MSRDGAVMWVLSIMLPVLLLLLAGCGKVPGAKIAFVSERDGNEEIYVMDADGSNVVRLTDDPARDAEPSWSP